jgi:fatty-acyl-CoA synthase
MGAPTAGLRLPSHQAPDPSDATDGFATELLAWLRQRLVHYKCTRSISFEAHLPRTDTGKLFKKVLVEKYSEAAI